MGLKELGKMSEVFTKKREHLQKVILERFGDEFASLTPELQEILADDLVTALHNRLAVLKRMQRARA